MRMENKLNVLGTKVLSTFFIVAVVSLVFAGIISLSDAGSFDGDHMQDANGTNTTATQQVIRKGWGYIQGNSNFAIVDPVINYGIIFDEVPFLIFNFANSRNVADGAPTDLAECTTTRTVIGTGINQTTSGFQPLLRTTGGTGFPPSVYYCYTWVAIGKDSSSFKGWDNGAGDDIYYDGDIAVGTTDADNHGINAVNYISGKAGVRGADQSGSYLYAEGMLGFLNGNANGLNLPVSAFNVGVLGIKPANGQNGAAVYGWNNDDNTNNYAGLFVADGNSGTNYGIYASASGGSSNYAGYFKGNLYVDDLSTVSTSSDGPVSIGAKNGPYVTLDFNQVQAKASPTSQGALFLNYWGGHTYITGGASNTFLSHGGGKVGIRKTSADSDLHIKQSDELSPNSGTGGIRLEANTTTDYWQIWNSNPFINFAYNGTGVAHITTTGLFITTSDARAKKDIQDIDAGVLEKALKLKPVKFRYNFQDETEKQSIGFIAQDVQELFPELVYTEDGSSLALAYSDFGVLAIEAIQELKDEKDSEISLLKAENAELKNVVCELKPDAVICE